MEENLTDDVDYDVRAFAEMLTTLPAWTPVASWFEESDPQSADRWWSSQREHMIFYFMEQLYPQPHYRGNQNPRQIRLSAQMVYNSICCPEALVWIHEALNTTPRKDLEKLCIEALSKRRGNRERLNWLKSHGLNWEKVAASIQHRPELQGREKTTSDLKKRSANIINSSLLLG